MSLCARMYVWNANKTVNFEESVAIMREYEENETRKQVQQKAHITLAMWDS